MGKAFVLALAAGAAVFWRLRYGVDFTDESYYAAMALRFARGDTPFLDELFVNQTAVLLYLPFVKLYHHWFGTEGLVYFLRLLYFAFASGLTAAAYQALSLFGKRSTALAASLLFLAIIPLNIPALSYNTLGGGGFALAVFLSLAATQTRGRWTWAGAMGALALSELAYPPLFAAGLVLFGTLLHREKGSRRFLAVSYLGAHLLVGFLLVPVLFRAGLGISEAILYSWTAHGHGGGADKWGFVFRFLVGSLEPLAALSFALVILALLTRKRSLLILHPVLLLAAYAKWIYPSVWWLAYFALSAPLLYLAGPRTASRRTLLQVGWVPCLAAGLVTAWTSVSSPANVTIGLWGGGVLSAFFLFEALAEVRWVENLGKVVTVSALVLFLFAGHTFYCDGTLPRLTEKIDSGPFRGLFTTKEKKEYLDLITADIKRLEDPLGRVVFYEFPAGYLFTEMRPGVNSAWMRTVSAGKDFYARYYDSHRGPRDLVFAVHVIDHGYPSPIRYSSDDPFIGLVRNHHHLVLDRGAYQVFTPKVGVASRP